MARNVKKAVRKTLKKAAKRAKSSKSPPGIVPIGNVMSQLMARYGFQRQMAAEALEKAWNECVGPELAAVSRPAAKRRGCLEIVVTHNAYAQELAFREPELLAGLLERLPEENIRKLKFVLK